MKFGDVIEVNNRLRRVQCEDFSVEWRAKGTKATQAIFLGFRTLSNGVRLWGEYGYEYTPKKYFQAALVCDHPRRNPYYTLLNTSDLT